jgi:hypothetical protein
MADPSAHAAAPPAIACKAGEFLFREGERPGALFVIETGQVELLRALAGGPERLALLGAGDVAGEDCAFGRRGAGCSARAVIDSTVIRVAAEAFHDVLRVRPEVAGHVIGAIGRRLLEARVACTLAADADDRAQTPGPSPASAPAPAPSPAPAPAPPLPEPAVAARFVPDEGGPFPLPDGDEVVVGRSDPRTRFTPDLDLSPLDTGRTLSRRHATVRRTGKGFEIVEEPRVANGTFVNGSRLQTGQPVALANGDEVCFGLVRTVFRTS